ncbi:hypothetical protein ACFC00_30580 [Streptomyces adustus]|uniref:hypothetical protein n=1 Tax=Streptomyces adustus TaxID=1609272 RepID=UPI0035D5B08D
MSADRETNHHMTNHDIALMLAEAADEVEIGTAPTEAVVRGGRRRRARRWALATATALVVAGTAGTLALAGTPGGGRVAPAVTAPSQPTPPGLLGYRTVLAHGTDQGRPWKVYVDVWAAPRDAAQAQAQLSEMVRHGEMPVDARTASDLVGKTSFFVYRNSQAENSWSMHKSADAGDVQAGDDLESAAMPLEPGSKGPQRLVVGRVAKTARQVTCTWKDGTSTVVGRAAADSGDETPAGEFAIRSAQGSPDSWFVCLAPQGTSFESVKVTR